MMKPAPSLLKARLWMNAAVVSALAAHAYQGLNWAIVAGLISCALHAAVQWFGLRPTPLRWHRGLTQSAALRWLAPLLAAVAVGVLAWQFRTVFGREVGVTSLTILTAFKLWEYNKARDAQILAGLLFFLLLSVFLRQESALALAAVILSAVLTLSAWVYFNAQDGVGLSGSPPESHAPTQSWQAPLSETLRLALYGLPLAVLLFFIFPRIAGPLWGLPQDSSSSKIGLSSTMESGRFSKLALSDELTFRAKFSGSVPSAAQRYWRGPVLSDFDGLVWRALPWRADQTVKISPSFISELKLSPDVLQYQLVAEPHKQTIRVLLDTPLHIDSLLQLSPQLSPFGEPMLERETVQAMSDPALRWGAGLNSGSPQSRLELQHELDLHASSNPRTLAFASALRLRLGPSETDPTPFILATLMLYRNSFTYSLEPPTPAGRPQDAIDGFLFDTKTGYCEHFAASFVVLMRALDFPARVVTGYQGGDLNPQDGWMVVQQNAAHAWAEVLHPTRGWLRVDPTAAVAPWRVQLGGSQLQTTAGQAPIGVQGILKNTRDALLPLQQWAQATVRLWQDYGLNYGKNNQKTLFKTLGFDNVDATAVATIMGGGIAAWTLAMLFLHRHRAAKRSAHAQALATFDAQCKAIKRPRHPAQTPVAWFEINRSFLSDAQCQQLTAEIKQYEQAQYAKSNAR
jgi:protein-glutamine gamma-glutamyltransferase